MRTHSLEDFRSCTPDEVSLLKSILIECEDGFTIKSIDGASGPWVSIDDATKRTADKFPDDDSASFVAKRESLLSLAEPAREFVERVEYLGNEYFRLTDKGRKTLNSFEPDSPDQ